MLYRSNSFLYGGIMNFKLIKKEELKDIQSTGYYYQHEKTKAKVIILKNNDKNLVFKIKI